MHVCTFIGCFLIPLDFHLSVPLHFFAYVRISATLQKMACQDVRALCACVCACLVFCVTLDGVTGFPIKLNHRPDQC